MTNAGCPNVCAFGHSLWIEDYRPRMADIQLGGSRRRIDFYLDDSRLINNDVHMVSREFMEGNDLAGILENKGISSVEKARAVTECLILLQHLVTFSPRRFFIGDYKPSNIVLRKGADGNYRAKIIDLDALHTNATVTDVGRILHPYPCYAAYLPQFILRLQDAMCAQLRNAAQLRFGTSGLRGLVAEMTDMECYINTRGFIRYLRSLSQQEGGIEQAAKVFMAGDFRKSTTRIMRAVAQAIADEGCMVGNCGFIPTQALMYFALQHKSASIMVTGSHIPEDRNGIKFNTAKGEVLKSDEAGIQHFVFEVRKEVYGTLGKLDCMFDTLGGLRIQPQLPEVDHNAQTVYVSRYLDVFDADALKGAKIVVYEHSAVGRDVLVDILQGLGADVIRTGRKDNEFIPCRH